MSTATMSYRRASQSWKISIFDPFNLSLSSYYWQSVIDFTRCHVDWIIQYVDFSDQLPSLSNVHLDSPMQLYGLIIHYFLSLSSISLFRYTVSSFLHLLMSFWVQVLATIDKDAISICVQIFRHMFSFL